MAKVILSAEKL